MITCTECGREPSLNAPTTTPALLERIRQLDRCNAYPFGSERLDLENFVGEGRAYSAYLRARITVLKQTWKKLEQERKTHDYRVASAARALHPIRAIPQEILAEIFVAVVKGAPPVTFNQLRMGTFQDSLSMGSPSWVLSQVSSGWRSTALTTPQLWTNLSLNFEEYANNRSILYLLDRYLSRSAARELSVNLFCRDESITLHCAFPTLLLSCSRWKSAQLSLHIAAFKQLEHLPDPFLKLETMTLDCHARSPHEPVNAFTASTTPCLRSVAFMNSKAISRIRLDWRQLHHYHGVAGENFAGTGTSGAYHLIVMSAAQNLQSAVLTLEDDDDDLLDAAEIELTQLRSLVLRGTAIGITGFCDKLTLSSLEHLQYHSSDPLSHLLSGSALIATHSQNLTGVSFTMISPDDGEEIAALTRILRETPTIRRLELVGNDECFDLEALCSALVATKEKPIAPSLDTLVIKAGHGCCLAPAVTAMITSRRTGIEGVGVLKRFEIDFVVESDDTVEVESAFGRFIIDGMEGYMLRTASADLAEATSLGFYRVL